MKGVLSRWSLLLAALVALPYALPRFYTYAPRSCCSPGCSRRA